MYSRGGGDGEFYGYLFGGRPPTSVWDSKAVSFRAPVEVSGEIPLTDCLSREAKDHSSDSGIYNVFETSPSDVSPEFEESFEDSMWGQRPAIGHWRGLALLKSTSQQLLGHFDCGEVTGDVVFRTQSTLFKGLMKKNVIVKGSLWLCGKYATRPMRFDIENTWFQLSEALSNCYWHKKKKSFQAPKRRRLLHCKGQLVTGYGLVQSGTFKCEYNPKDDCKHHYARGSKHCNVLLSAFDKQLASNWQLVSGRICCVYALKAEDALWKRIELKAKSPKFWLDCTTVPTLDNDAFFGTEKKATLFSGQLIFFDETLLRLLNLPAFVRKDWIYMGTFELSLDYNKFARFVAPSGHCRIFDASGKCMYDCKLSKNNANLLKGNLKKCFKGKGKMKKLAKHMQLLPHGSFT